MPAVQTIAFTSTTTTFSVSIGGVSLGTWNREAPLESHHRIDCTDNEIVVALNNGTYKSFTVYNTDTVTINAVEWEGTIRELFEELNSEVFYVPYVAEDEVVIYKRKTTLTDAQIKALPSTLVELVPAPGADKALYPHSTFFRLTNNEGTYTDCVGASWQIYYDTFSAPVSSLVLAESILSVAEGDDVVGSFSFPIITDGSGDFSGEVVHNPGAATIASADINNKALKIGESGYAYMGSAYTGGHANNTLEVTVFYSIVDL